MNNMQTICLVSAVLGLVDRTLAADPVWVLPAAATASPAIDEGSAAGTSVFTLEATDGDSDTLTYSISSQTNGDNFEVSGTTLQVKAGANLDYETHTSHDLVFSVTDGTASVESETLTVNLNDVNDEAPVFSPASYDINVQEGTAQGTSVLTVTANDGDVTAAFKTFTFSIALLINGRRSC